MVLDRSPAYLGQLQSRFGIDPSPARSDLDKTRKSYLLACSVEGKSALTVESYSRQLRVLVDFVDPLGIKQLSDVDTQLVRLFLLYLREEKKVGKSTVNRYYRCLSAFFNWSVREGLVKDSPIRNIKTPEVPKTIPRPFSPEDIQNMLLLCAGHDFLSLRNRATVLVFFDTGLRLEEMSNVQVGDMDLSRRTIRVMGKGQKERVVKFGREAEKALLLYLMARSDDLPYLWVTDDRRPMPREAIRLTIKRLCRRAGVKDAKLGPHAFRHAFGTTAIRNGANVFYVQELLGHSTLTMTRRYASTIDSEEAIKAHDQFSPADRLLGRGSPYFAPRQGFDATHQMVAAHHRASPVDNYLKRKRT